MALSEQPTRKYLSAWFVVPALIVVSSAVRLYAFVGICRLDMFRYLEISNHVLRGGSIFDPQVFYASARLPLIVPLISMNAVAGFGEHVSAGWPLACSVGAVVITYLLGRELFGPFAGLLSGILMAFFPLEVELGTQLLPDAIESFFVLTAMYLAVLAIRRDTRWQVWAVLSGVSLVIAYQTRVNAAMFIVGLLAVVLLNPSRWRRAAWLIGGVVSGVIVFLIAFWVLSGDPIVDLHKTQAFYESYRSVGFIERKATFGQMILEEPSLSLLPSMAFIGVLGLAFTRRDVRGRMTAKWLLLAWAAAFYVYLDLISPMHGLDSSYRYAEPMVAPIILLCAAAIDERFAVRTPRVRLLSAVLGAAILVSMINTSAEVATRFRANHRWTAQRQAAAFARAHPNAAFFVTDKRSLVSLNYYSGYSLGRDTLEPANHEVNRDARLFLLSEEPSMTFPERYLFIETSAAPIDQSPIDTYPFLADPLGVYPLR